MRMPELHFSRRARAGFSLVEMMVVVAIIGILTLMALPRIDTALSRRDVAAAKSGLANLFLRAKVAAVSNRRPTTVSVASGSAYATLTTVTGTTQYVGGMIVFSNSGVTASPSAGSLTIQPTGLVTNGTPFTVRLTKGSITDSVVVLGYGRVQ
jgi:prepilin-type N-terminal cleavage/methylation domain-containing protein